MLYTTLKVIVRFAIRIFCRHIIVNKPALLKEKGPLLLACNHPNSFLDGVILDTLFEQPVHSLARGDVFRKPLFAKLLRKLNLLPVYRTSEGVENLNYNYDTFDECLSLFRENAIIIIFSEGKCINEWHLRPLKKGTARLSVAAWKEGIPLRVLPVGINYSSFRRFGKNLWLNFGDVIKSDHLDLSRPDGMLHQQFNQLLQEQLSRLVLEIPKKDREKQQRLLGVAPKKTARWLLAIPAFIGLILHAPLYFPIRHFTYSRTNHNDHYDSVLTGLLLFIYPVYLLVLGIAIYFLAGILYALLLLVVAPLTARALVELKPQLDR